MLGMPIAYCVNRRYAVLYETGKLANHPLAK